MVALMAVIAHATAQDLDEKYATDLLKAGTKAPDMRVGTGKDGKAVRLSDLKGKYVLINFLPKGDSGAAATVAEVRGERSADSGYIL